MIIFHHKFTKKFKKLDKKIREKVSEVIIIFENNAFDSRLRNHSLHGDFVGYRSIDVTSDIRIIYKNIGEDTCFIFIGSHSDLYK